MRKTEHMPYGKARAHHAADNKQSRHHSRPSGIHKLFEAEFQTEREKQHHNAQLWAQNSILSSVVTDGRYSKFGLARNPATI